MSGTPIPVSLLSGFLGAGKTTLLQHILLNREGLRVGVLVNDMAGVNVDAESLRGVGLHSAPHAHVVRTTETLVELSNGCICCTLREDLLAALLELADPPGRFDALVVESSGISEPLPVAETFTFVHEESGRTLSDFARLDTTVTLVDGANFPRDWASRDALVDRDIAAAPGDSRAVVDLLVDQVEFADVLVLNKVDLLTPAEVATLSGLLTKLNPTARIITAEHGRVPLDAVLRTGSFSMARAASAPGWLRELRGSHVPESVEYGITSFVFRARRPFHPARLSALIHAAGTPTGDLRPVLRSKGFAWLAVDGGMDEVALWAQAGRVWQLSQGRPWWATVDRSQWPPGLEALLGVGGGSAGVSATPAWHATYGDRGTEVVFIGRDMDEARVKGALEAALVNDEEWARGPELWDGYDDPFDFFPYEDELEEEGGDGEEDEGEAAMGGASGGGGAAAAAPFHVHSERCSHGAAEDALVHGHSAPPPTRPNSVRIFV